MRFGKYAIGWQQFGQRGLGRSFGPNTQGQGVKPVTPSTAGQPIGLLLILTKAS